MNPDPCSRGAHLRRHQGLCAKGQFLQRRHPREKAAYQEAEIAGQRRVPFEGGEENWGNHRDELGVLGTRKKLGLYGGGC